MFRMSPVHIAPLCNQRSHCRQVSVNAGVEEPPVSVLLLSRPRLLLRWRLADLLVHRPVLFLALLAAVAHPQTARALGRDCHGSALGADIRGVAQTDLERELARRPATCSHLCLRRSPHRTSCSVARLLSRRCPMVEITFRKAARSNLAVNRVRFLSALRNDVDSLENSTVHHSYILMLNLLKKLLLCTRCLSAASQACPRFKHCRSRYRKHLRRS